MEGVWFGVWCVWERLVFGGSQGVVARYTQYVSVDERYKLVVDRGGQMWCRELLMGGAVSVYAGVLCLAVGF